MAAAVSLINGSRWVVRAGWIINRTFLVAVLLGTLASLLFPHQFLYLLLHPETAASSSRTLTGVRCELLLGIAMSIAADRLFVALAAMIASTRAGDPFVAANAGRLRAIGWSLLALQLLDIPGTLIETYVPALHSGTPGSFFSPGGWLAVLMVFVLSRVFAAGSAMREDLEGTV